MRRIITVIASVIALLGVFAPLSASPHPNPKIVPAETIEFDEWIVPSLSNSPIEYIEFEPEVLRVCTPSCTIDAADNSLTPAECSIQNDRDQDEVSAEISTSQEPFLR